MAKIRKKTPKSSNRHKKSKGRKEDLIAAGIFVVFIAVLVFLFYFLEIPSFKEDAVAVVNGNEITREQLDWWYKTSILPEYRDIITKQDFLMLSLIPQEVLLQKAKEENIKVTKDEVERLLGLFVIENGLTLDEFEKHLKSRGITLNEIKKSFEIRAVITKLLEKEKIDFNKEEKELFFDENEKTFQGYLNILINNSKIEIFPENIDKLVLRTFETTKDKICNEEKPAARLYTTTSCSVCDESGKIFKRLVKELVEDEKMEAFYWSLDTGDDLLTAKKENGVPKEEVAIFKKYSPDKLVPTIVLGCKYKRVGKLSNGDEEEFKAILKTLIG